MYLNWAEQARLTAFAALGFGLDAVLTGDVLYNLARVELDFRRPTHLGDRLVIGTRLEGIGTSSIRLRHPMVRAADGELVCEVRDVIVWLGDDGRPLPVPEDVRARLGRLAEVGEGEGAAGSGAAGSGAAGSEGETGAEVVEAVQAGGLAEAEEVAELAEVPDAPEAAGSAETTRGNES